MKYKIRLLLSSLFTLFLIGSLSAQSFQVTGKVTNKLNGEPLSGAGCDLLRSCTADGAGPAGKFHRVDDGARQIAKGRSCAGSAYVDDAVPFGMSSTGDARAACPAQQGSAGRRCRLCSRHLPARLRALIAGFHTAANEKGGRWAALMHRLKPISANRIRRPDSVPS